MHIKGAAYNYCRTFFVMFLWAATAVVLSMLQKDINVCNKCFFKFILLN